MKPTLETRLEALEKQVAELQAAFARLPGRDSWESTIGMFTGDEGMKQVFRDALKLREEDRKRSLKPRKRSPRSPARS